MKIQINNLFKLRTSLMYKFCNYLDSHPSYLWGKAWFSGLGAGQTSSFLYNRLSLSAAYFVLNYSNENGVLKKLGIFTEL